MNKQDNGLTAAMSIACAVALIISIFLIGSSVLTAVRSGGFERGGSADISGAQIREAEAADEMQASDAAGKGAAESDFEIAGKSTAESSAESMDESAAEGIAEAGSTADGSRAESMSESTAASAAESLSEPGAESSQSGAWPEEITEVQDEKHIVCIDPGHQDHGMSETEPNGPGSSVMKAKLTTGTEGTATGIPEYQVNLEIGLLLKEELKNRGYAVVMTRETNDVSISNAERAVLAENAGAEAFVRLHCNGSENSSACGVVCYAATAANAYLTPEVIEGSEKLAQAILEAQTAATGQKSLGVIAGDDMTGINWASMPVTIVEMGYMSNPDEDRYLSSPEGQAAIVQGIADGIDAFFAGT